MAPVYAPGAPTPDVAARRAALRGFVTGTLDADALAAELGATLPRGARLRVTDGDAAVIGSPGGAWAGDPGVVDAAGRKLTVEVAGTGGASSTMPLTIALGGPAAGERGGPAVLGVGQPRARGAGRGGHAVGREPGGAGRAAAPDRATRADPRLRRRRHHRRGPRGPGDVRERGRGAHAGTIGRGPRGHARPGAGPAVAGRRPARAASRAAGRRTCAAPTDPPSSPSTSRPPSWRTRRRSAP